MGRGCNVKQQYLPNPHPHKERGLSTFVDVLLVPSKQMIMFACTTAIQCCSYQTLFLFLAEGESGHVILGGGGGGGRGGERGPDPLP